MVAEVADGARGPAPQNVLFLSGDVHYSYLAEVERGHGGRILQAVCSPVRNPLPRFLRWFAVVMSYGLATPVGAAAARSVKVPDAPFEWHTVKGPWFDNNLALLQDGADGLRLTWHRGVVERGDERNPRLEEVASITVPADRDAELSV
jgi:hypothetical protein